MVCLRSVRLRCALAVLGALATLAACGGGGGDDEPDFLTFTSVLGGQLGFEGTIDAGGAIASSTGGLEIGDREGQVPAGPVRAFLSFDISGLPANATITQARLRCDLTFVTGGPYVALGDLVVDHVVYGANFPPSTAYADNAILGNIATLTNSAVLGVKTANVLLAVNADRQASRPRTQLRLRFSNLDQDFNGQNTFVRFRDSGGTGGGTQIPTIEVVYQVPN